MINHTQNTTNVLANTDKAQRATSFTSMGEPINPKYSTRIVEMDRNGKVISSKLKGRQSKLSIDQKMLRAAERREKAAQRSAKNRADRAAKVAAHVSQVIPEGTLLADMRKTIPSIDATDSRVAYASKLLTQSAIYAIALDSSIEPDSVGERNGIEVVRQSNEYLNAQTLLDVSRKQGFSKPMYNRKAVSQKWTLGRDTDTWSEVPSARGARGSDILINPAELAKLQSIPVMRPSNMFAIATDIADRAACGQADILKARSKSMSVKPLLPEHVYHIPVGFMDSDSKPCAEPIGIKVIPTDSLIAAQNKALAEGKAAHDIVVADSKLESDTHRNLLINARLNVTNAHNRLYSAQLNARVVAQTPEERASLDYSVAFCARILREYRLELAVLMGEVSASEIVAA